MFISDEVNIKEERLLVLSPGLGPSAKSLIKLGKCKSVQYIYRPSEQELEQFGVTTEEYLDLPGEDKCMLEIRIRIKKMQNWVGNNSLELTRDAVLKYM